MSVAGFLKVVVFLFALVVGAAQAFSAVKGYQEWKQEKVQVAMTQGIAVRAQLIKAAAENNRKQVEILERQLAQLNWNVEVARDLSVTDYFVLYLSQQPNADRFQQAAQKMSTKEVAELIEAYSNTLGTTAAEAVVKPAPQAVIPGKLPIQAIQAK
jgi:hypothetical protein